MYEDNCILWTNFEIEVVLWRTIFSKAAGLPLLALSICSVHPETSKNIWVRVNNRVWPLLKNSPITSVRVKNLASDLCLFSWQGGRERIFGWRERWRYGNFRSFKKFATSSSQLFCPEAWLCPFTVSNWTNDEALFHFWSYMRPNFLMDNALLQRLPISWSIIRSPDSIEKYPGLLIQDQNKKLQSDAWVPYCQILSIQEQDPTSWNIHLF